MLNIVVCLLAGGITKDLLSHCISWTRSEFPSSALLSAAISGLKTIASCMNVQFICIIASYSFSEELCSSASSSSRCGDNHIICVYVVLEHLVFWWFSLANIHLQKGCKFCTAIGGPADCWCGLWGWTSLWSKYWSHNSCVEVLSCS